MILLVTKEAYNGEVRIGWVFSQCLHMELYLRTAVLAAFDSNSSVYLSQGEITFLFSFFSPKT